MNRLTKWIGVAAVFAVSACGPAGPPAPETPVLTSLPRSFALIARIPEKESGHLEKLLSKDVLPSIGRSHLVRSVTTYSTRSQGEVVYVLEIELRRAQSSPNIAFEILADGRSFEDARALQTRIKKYFQVSPTVATYRRELSVDRAFPIQLARAQEGT